MKMIMNAFCNQGANSFSPAAPRILTAAATLLGCRSSEACCVLFIVFCLRKLRERNLIQLGAASGEQ